MRNAGVHEHDVRDDREDERQADHGGARDLQPRDDAGEVHPDDQEEERHQDGQEALALLLAERVEHDRVADEAEHELESGLAAGRNELHVPRAEPEPDDEGEDHEQADQHDPVELEGRPDEEQAFGDEFADRRTDEATIRFVGRDEQKGGEERGGNQEILRRRASETWRSGGAYVLSLAKLSRPKDTLDAQRRARGRPGSVSDAHLHVVLDVLRQLDVARRTALGRAGTR